MSTDATDYASACASCYDVMIISVWGSRSDVNIKSMRMQG